MLKKNNGMPAWLQWATLVAVLYCIMEKKKMDDAIFDILSTGG